MPNCASTLPQLCLARLPSRLYKFNVVIDAVVDGLDWRMTRIPDDLSGAQSKLVLVQEIKNDDSPIPLMLWSSKSCINANLLRVG